ncbi:hypothetical protein L6164_011608 [Bauhinia variegata]|uniref:Uncharacterized protein n=1 Tax=Bauhinia variegata TaxID=167791 RepID=A0ACB9P8V4_BAUVA|nr:hypothetical protein L6164_011608 [Bauhinia variegata]
MLSSAPSKILIGLSLDIDDSKELLSWAISVLARPNDTIVAVNVLVTNDKKKKHVSFRRRQSQLRQAKAYVISLLGEFARICWTKQVNLEARVALSSTVGGGLVEEAKSISADFLLLRGSRNQSNNNKTKTFKGITNYCLEHVPQCCTLISVGKSANIQEDSTPNSAHSQDDTELSSRWIDKDKQSDMAAFPVVNLKQFLSETKIQNCSPRTVLEAFEGQSNSTEDDTFSTRVSSITDTSLPPKVNKRRKPKSPFRIIASLLASPFRRKSRTISKNQKQQPLLKCFSYLEISTATRDFSQDNLVGKGGYSEVYRGDLRNGQSIAVKRLAKDNNDPNKEKEFLMELGVIGHVCHPNTATLVGYCIEHGLYLIFNYSQNGNLATALHGKTGNSLEWPIRYKIAIGVARGLHYLHKCCQRRIIHRDIKASNVLLSPDYEPQITDFGLAKWLPNKWTHHAVIPIEGTFGYLAPEYFMHGIVDEKTDVYAFGILLLEIVTGRRPVDSSKQNLLLWAKPLMESGNIAELADPRLEGKYDEEQLYTLVLTASYCVKQPATWRPPMSEVLELLTSNKHSEAGRKSWRIPNFTSDELDDYSMVFGYKVPSDISLEDFL